MTRTRDWRRHQRERMLKRRWKHWALIDTSEYQIGMFYKYKKGRFIRRSLEEVHQKLDEWDELNQQIVRRLIDTPIPWAYRKRWWQHKDYINRIPRRLRRNKRWFSELTS